MWLEELQLTDFRGFRHLTLDLRRQLTVVIGVNGAGKSSVVRAIEICANHPLPALGRLVAPAKHDVRLGQQACRIEVSFGGMRFAVTRTSSERIENQPPVLPEGMSRPQCLVLSSDRAVLKKPQVVEVSLDGPLDTWFELGERWFHAREDLENQERVRSRRLDHADPGLDLVRRAMSCILPGYSDLHIDRNRPDGPATSQLVLIKNGEELTADMLSEGERSQLVLAMTIARRLFEEDPSVRSERAAIVVIDEIELHLHPEWQLTAVPSLLRAFPTCQFIITTHSPQVIGSVPLESIVVLDDFAIQDALTDANARVRALLEVAPRSTASSPALRPSSPPCPSRP